MTAIRLTFEVSRYHATPWGRHVNEGVTEWPPSPYRFLRALYDVWQRKYRDIAESSVEELLGQLGSSDPLYLLPRASPSHTRSYLSSNSMDPTDKNLVFDAFMALDRGASCMMMWPSLELSPEHRELLARMLEGLNYLGRSESWVTAEVADGLTTEGYRCEPVTESSVTSGEDVPVAGVVTPANYSGKRNWLSALTTSSADILRARASEPPLLRWVRYGLEEGSVDLDPPSRMERKEPNAQAVLISLDSKLLPLVTSTIEVAEQIRVRLMGAHKKRMGGDISKVSSCFSGKNADGSMRLDHGHIFILPLRDVDGLRIDRVLLLSRNRPLTRDELDAVRGVRELWQADNRPEVRCVISWQGELSSDVAGANVREAVSVTPFVTTRHMRKGRELNAFLVDEVIRECRHHGLPPVEAIERLERIEGKFDIVEYRLNRKKDNPSSGYAFKIRFKEEVRVPFSLGYACHYGLGQFHAPARG